ncbi:MAG: calcium/proton exchanger [Paenibacillaceae bacterium]
MRDRLFYYGLAVAVAGSAITHYANMSAVLQFIIAGIAIVFVAGFLGKATESVAHYAGERIGGFLNATFGNAAELIIAIVLIQRAVNGQPHLFDMVKASITGSIIGNMLLVLGLSVLFGGLKFKSQNFNIKLAGHNASLMLLAVITLFIPAMFAKGLSIEKMNTFSLIVSVILILCYLLWLFFSMITHKNDLKDHKETTDEMFSQSKWSLKQSIFYLFVATVLVGFVSEWLVGTLDQFSEKFGLSELFVGAFLIAIIGNAAEHSAAIMMALKNKMGASVEIAIGSSLQIALFVAPLLVIISFFMGETMNMVFTTYELVAIGVSVFIAKSISQDGSTNWFEGVLLLVVYLILGIAFYIA